MRPAILVTVVVLAACTHAHDVRDVGNGMYSVTGSSATGGYTGSHEENIEQANHYCRKTGEQAVIDSFDDKPGVGPKGEQTSTMVFTCGPRPVLQFK